MHMRSGVVLSPNGGALARLLPLFRLGAGGRLGKGNQWMSWIALPDLISAVFYLIGTPELNGAVNITAPEPVTNAEFTQMLAKTLHRLAIFPAPAFALHFAFGEMTNEALLASQRVVPQKLKQSGFSFEHPDIGHALTSMLP